MKRLCLMLLCVLTVVVWADSIPAGWYEFSVDPTVFSGDALGSVSFLNVGPADRRIRVRGRHFVNEDGERIRFFGSNTCFANAFPDKSLAPLLAGRMKQMGFNVLRFHSMDRNHIWKSDMKTLDPVQLDKLHWFIYQLKLNGIYANINLHVNRRYPGMSQEDRQRFYFGKTLDRFHPPFIQMQKDYARDLLLRVNPYTGLSLAEDPCVAFVEINNENDIRKLTEPKGLDTLRGTPYEESLTRLWRQWLRKRHADDLEGLKRSWSSMDSPYEPENLLVQAALKCDGLKAGAFEVSDSEAGHDFRVLKEGKVPWSYQAHVQPVPLRANSQYTCEFEIRSDSLKKVSLRLGNARAPFRDYARASVPVTAAWVRHSIMLRVADLTPNMDKRLTFCFDGKVHPLIQLRKVELHRGARKAETLTWKSFDDIPLPQASSSLLWWKEFRTFLVETDFATSRTMHDYLKKELKVKSMIADTQVCYGGLTGLYREERLSDYGDMHSYWDHPHFQPNHGWSGLYWNIWNTPMVSADRCGIFSWTTYWRIAGKPMTVSEYDHPSPNEHNHEMYPLLCAYASVQDWDGLYQFSYENPFKEGEPAELKGFFSMSLHPSKMAMATLAAMAFRRGLISPSDKVTQIQVPVTMIRDQLIHGLPMFNGTIPGFPTSIMFHSRVETKTVPAGDRLVITGGHGAGYPYVAGAMTWTNKNRRGLCVVKEDAYKSATGYLGDRERFDLDGFVFQVRLDKPDTASVMLVSLDGKETSASDSMLLAVAGTVTRVGMRWYDKRTSCKKDWGTGPVITRFIPAAFTLPGRRKPTVTALDGNGMAKGTVMLTGKPGAWTFQTSMDMPTMWYKISR